ncbi:MAG: RNA polymerase sigma factor [Planctomycetota bacterium]
MTQQTRREADELLAHADSVYRFLLRWLADVHLAEDMTQQTFLRAWSSMRDGTEIRSPRSWLLRIARNLVSDRFRERPVDQVLDWDVAGPLTWESSKQLTDREDVAIAMAALDRLPGRQRMVLHLIAVEQLSVNETAELLELSPGGVRSHLATARARMRELLNEQDPDRKDASTTKSDISST